MAVAARNPLLIILQEETSEGGADLAARSVRLRGTPSLGGLGGRGGGLGGGEFGDLGKGVNKVGTPSLGSFSFGSNKGGRVGGGGDLGGVRA